MCACQLLTPPPSQEPYGDNPDTQSFDLQALKRIDENDVKFAFMQRILFFVLLKWRNAYLENGMKFVVFYHLGLINKDKVNKGIFFHPEILL